MLTKSLEEKAYSRYMGKGDYGMDIENGWALIVQDNNRNQYTRICEVFGFYHEFGSVYAKNIRPLTKDEFLKLKAATRTL